MTAAVVVSELDALANEGHSVVTHDRFGLLESEAASWRHLLERLEWEVAAEATAANRKLEDLEAAILLARREREAAQREATRTLETDGALRIASLESLIQSTLESTAQMENDGAEQLARAVSLGGPWEAWKSHQQQGDKAQGGDRWLDESVQQLTQRLQAAQQVGTRLESQLKENREAIQASRAARDEDHAHQDMRDMRNAFDSRADSIRLREWFTSKVTQPAPASKVSVAPAIIPSTTIGLSVSTASDDGVEEASVVRPNATSISILASNKARTVAMNGSSRKMMVESSTATGVPVPISPINTAAEVQSRALSLPRTAPVLRPAHRPGLASASTPKPSFPSPVRSRMSDGECNFDADVAALPPSPVSCMVPELKGNQSKTQRSWSIGKQTGLPTPPSPRQKHAELAIPNRRAYLRSGSSPRRNQFHRPLVQSGFSNSTSAASAANTSYVGSSIHIEASDGPPSATTPLTLRSDVEYYNDISSFSYASADSWSVDSSLRVDPVLDPFFRVTQVKVLDSDVVASVTDAVDALNKGTIHCPDDICLVFSASNSAYFVLWQEGRQDTAYNWLAQVEAESSPASASQCVQIQTVPLAAATVTTQSAATFLTSWPQEGSRRMVKVVKGASSRSAALAASSSSSQAAVVESVATAPRRRIQVLRSSPGTTPTGTSLNIAPADASQGNAAQTSSMREYPLMSRASDWVGAIGSTGLQTQSSRLSTHAL